jgi:hypothetical protein
MGLMGVRSAAFVILARSGGIPIFGKALGMDRDLQPMAEDDKSEVFG